MPRDFLNGDNAHFAQAGAFPLTIHQAVVESPSTPSLADQSDAVTCTDLSVCPVEA